MRLPVEQDQMITVERTAELVKQIGTKEVTKSGAIREMFAGGMAVKDISKTSGIPYTHVYNIVRNEVLVHGLEVVDKGRGHNGTTQKRQILALLEQGKTLTEVSTELQCLYNRVWQVAKEAGYTNKQKAARAEQEAVIENVDEELIINLKEVM